VPEKTHVTRIGEEGNVQLEDYGLILFISLRYNLFCELDDRFKMGVMLFLRLSQTSMVNCKKVGAGAEERKKKKRRRPLVPRDSG